MTQPKKKKSALGWTLRAIVVMGVGATVAVPIMQDRAYQELIQKGITLPNNIYIQFSRPQTPLSYEDAKETAKKFGLSIPALDIAIAKERSYLHRPLQIAIYEKKPENPQNEEPLLRYQATAHLGLVPSIDYFMILEENPLNTQSFASLEAGRIEGTLTGQFKEIYVRNPIIMGAFSNCEPGKCQMWLKPQGKTSYKVTWNSQLQRQIPGIDGLFPLAHLSLDSDFITHSHGELSFDMKKLDTFSLKVSGEEYFAVPNQKIPQAKYEQRLVWNSQESDEGTTQNISLTMQMPERMSQLLFEEKSPAQVDLQMRVHTPVVGLLPNLDKFIQWITDNTYRANTPFDIRLLLKTPLTVEVQKGFVKLGDLQASLEGSFAQTFPNHEEQYLVHMILQYNESVKRFARQNGFDFRDNFGNVDPDVIQRPNAKEPTYRYRLNLKERNNKRTYSVNNRTVLEGNDVEDIPAFEDKTN